MTTLWDERAALGAKAGSDDLIGAELERRAIRRCVTPGQRVIEHGCGTGQLARELHARGATVRAYDASLPMIWKARELTPERSLALSFECQPCDGRWGSKDALDVIVTQRMLINLDSWPTQRLTIARFAERLRVGGRYLMCENSLAGLGHLNRWRTRLGLPAIVPPSHNRYLTDSEIAEIPSYAPLRLIAVRYPCSTYAVMSRLVNAALAYYSHGQPPRYDAWPNRLARHLPALGSFGQNRLWVWERI